MISMMYVAVLVLVVVSDDVVVVVVVVEVAVGVADGFAPGVSICPADTETASIKLRSAAALIWRKVFTLGASIER